MASTSSTVIIDPGRVRPASHEKIQVVEYTDPYSIWCWGLEPAIRRFEVVYPERVEIEIKMGGLFEDFTPMRDYWIRMSGGKWKESVRTFMLGVAGQHQMPMDPDKMLASIDDFRSTWPACVAVKAAELEGRDPGRRYLRRLREAALVNGRAIHRSAVQLELASEVGVDRDGISRAVADGSADGAFRKDLDECRALGITGFPTTEFHRGDLTIRIEGWQPWEVFDESLRKLGTDIEPRTVRADRLGVTEVLRRFDRCATREVGAVFGLTDDEAEILLEDLEARGDVVRREAGTGLLWELAV
ncbi:MAG TPA: DsbA family protein [Thermoplasmata archaeon]|nr:DsbA family protein [Thermoplasmata archaeon]